MGSQTIELVWSSGASRDAAYQTSSGASDRVARRPLLRFVQLGGEQPFERAAQTVGFLAKQKR
jgi:hypothetical protein